MAKTRSDLTMEFVRSTNELRNNLRQFIQLKIKEHGIDITFEMLEVMFYLWRKDGINQQVLSDITFRDKSSMTYLLDNLVKRNLVQRTTDSIDRRSKIITLTDSGRWLEEQLHPWLLELYAITGGELSKPELQEGVKLINTMIVNLKTNTQSS